MLRRQFLVCSGFLSRTTIVDRQYDNLPNKQHAIHRGYRQSYTRHRQVNKPRPKHDNIIPRNTTDCLATSCRYKVGF